MTDEKQEGGASRRDLLGGAAVGIAAVSAMARPAMAQEQKSPGAPMSERAAGFATPPFPKQKQPWPGLTSKMSPRPDRTLSESINIATRSPG